ncbi:MAG: pirin family protein [Deltaproteobacteria bacterium]
MSVKLVEKIFNAPVPHYVGDGFRVHNFIPSLNGLSMQRMDPFLMLDYNSQYIFPPSEKQKGVGVHPHKGFETVTIAYKGSVAHHDSAGNSGVIYEGDVQWMTAASGVLHKEYHEKEFSKKGGVFQMVQMWVNLPAEFKLTSPKYQAISNSSLGKYFLDNNQGLIEVIAGEYNGIKGPASTFTEINVLNSILEDDAEAAFSFPAEFTTFLLLIEGSLIINNSEIVLTDQLALFHYKGENFNLKAREKSKILILSGKPIKEPIAAYGPFVMNTREEIVGAYNEFHTGKFGFLED